MLLVSVVVIVALVTVMSGIGVCERCGVGSGGVYSMISTVLGGRVGGTVGLLYVFGQVRNTMCVYVHVFIPPLSSCNPLPSVDSPFKTKIIQLNK
jgi:amino acid transporter